MRCFMNYSKQRQIILDYINQCHCHPSADKVYEEVKKIVPKISFSTVYRNLNQLVEQKLIKKISLDGEKYIFDDVMENHAHFYCTKCGTLEDIWVSDEISIFRQKLDYQVQSIEVVVKGICNKCKER